MEKEFVTYNQALALKDLGFDEPCFMFYYDEGYGLTRDVIIKTSKDSNPCNAPLKQQAFSFFREKHKLHSTITSISQESWQWHITKPGESLGKLYNEDFYTYEEAEQACLDKLIEIIKNK